MTHRLEIEAAEIDSDLRWRSPANDEFERLSPYTVGQFARTLAALTREPAVRLASALASIAFGVAVFDLWQHLLNL